VLESEFDRMGVVFRQIAMRAKQLKIMPIVSTVKDQGYYVVYVEPVL
jgi:hypothetical protein